MARPIGISSPRKVDTAERAMGTVVASHRVRNGFSQAALAEKLSCDISYISQLERGLINPSLRRILDLASALGVEAGMLVREADDKLRKSRSKRSNF
jgi:transcriptional regulator with XRE-family HTH domain